MFPYESVPHPHMPFTPNSVRKLRLCGDCSGNAPNGPFGPSQTDNSLTRTDIAAVTGVASILPPGGLCLRFHANRKKRHETGGSNSSSTPKYLVQCEGVRSSFHFSVYIFRYTDYYIDSSTYNEGTLSCTTVHAT